MTLNGINNMLQNNNGIFNYHRKKQTLLIEIFIIKNESFPTKLNHLLNKSSNT